MARVVGVLFPAFLIFYGNICFAGSLQANSETVEVDLKNNHFNYVESIGDSETGRLNGVKFDYKNQNRNTKQYWRVSYESTEQNTSYNGALQDGTPAQGITWNSITNTEITYASPVSDRDHVYAGIGYHNWKRDLLGPNGYLELYSWNYIPVGYRSEYKRNGKLAAVIDVQVKIPFNGTIHVSGDGYDSRQMMLSNKPGFKAELPFTYKMDPQWSMVVTPWYEYSAIGQSNKVALTQNGIPTDYLCYEPNSITHQYGINIGVSYKY